MIVAALAAGACAQRQAALPPVQGGTGWDDPSGPRSGAPSWAMEPLSWGKLDAIERWIEQTPRPDDYWRVESRLQLAEGQLEFSQEASAAASTRQFRRNAALEGFRTVIRDAGANRDQQLRAKLGTRAIDTARDSSTEAAPAAAPVRDLVRRARWRARAANPRKMTPASGRWSWITVHHSVISSSSDSLGASLDTVFSIQRDHMNNRGYADIGYHFLIDRAGRVIEGRELRWQGAHAGGSNNRGNVGICLLGNFDEEQPSRAALAALDRLVFELQNELRIPRRNVRPHKAWKETQCPGTHLMPWFTRR